MGEAYKIRARPGGWCEAPVLCAQSQEGEGEEEEEEEEETEEERGSRIRDPAYTLDHDSILIFSKPVSAAITQRRCAASIISGVRLSPLLDHLSVPPSAYVCPVFVRCDSVHTRTH